MTAMKWYKRDPDAALGGMMVLTLEERGAYNTILDLIYSHDNNLIDDDRFICGWLHCDIRVWKRIKNRLIELSKITLEGGLVTNFRATSEIDEALGRVASVSELNRIKGIKSGIARRKNKGLPEPEHEPKTNTPTPRLKEVRSKEEEGTNVPSLGEIEPPLFEILATTKTDAVAMKDAWNVMASQAGLPLVDDRKPLSEKRRKKAVARLREVGGFEGWQVCLEKIQRSPFLTGQVKDFRATFDWILEPDNLTKVMEGNYDGKTTNDHPKPGSRADNFAKIRAAHTRRKVRTSDRHSGEDAGGLSRPREGGTIVSLDDHRVPRDPERE